MDEKNVALEHSYANLSGEDELKFLDQDVWVFGYGSLIWKVDFDSVAKFPAYIRGFERRFAQKSEDHRGTVEYPGRVVTLLETGLKTDIVYGMCYCIEASKVKSILAHLDFREKNGYARHYVHVYHSHTHEKFKSPVLIYVGTMQNPQFVDPNSETLDDVAHVIATAHGPSGKNSEYLFNLAHALAEMNVVDEHVEKLTLMVKHKMSKAHQ